MIHDGAALPAFSFEFISILANAPAHFFVIFFVCFFFFWFFLQETMMARWWCDAIWSVLHHCRHYHQQKQGGAAAGGAKKELRRQRRRSQGPARRSPVVAKAAAAAAAVIIFQSPFSPMLFRMAGRWSRSSTNRSVAFSSFAAHFMPVEHHQRCALFSLPQCSSMFRAARRQIISSIRVKVSLLK